ncbi:pentatricopeptide repeat-containing protein [Dorcoceras hygrometricum]|uniref:Pentatricopeptide repeat-containing protein n=1 Tax=Dorcoceras hygrometricum TaxID=472368 RepID=A0A2Z6ZW53_9LAMI|nr:pentatricopeptide repeat-containing protein [Dorcoceras hygrometricum]
MLATGFPNDWVDQTMSYQLIQTTSFAMHPRLVNYIIEALVWMYCSCLLVIPSQRAYAESLARNDLLVNNSLDWILLPLPADCDDITTDVIITDPAFSLLQRLLAQQLISLHLLIMMTSPITSSSMVHLDVPPGSLLMFQLVHLPLLALAAGSYRSNWFTMLQQVQLGLRLITNN